jgi:hypothetical protein
VLELASAEALESEWVSALDLVLASESEMASGSASVLESETVSLSGVVLALVQALALAWELRSQEVKSAPEAARENQLFSGMRLVEAKMRSSLEPLATVFFLAKDSSFLQDDDSSYGRNPKPK